MPRKPRSGNHSNGGNQHRHGSKRKGSHTKGKDRAKADNLQFDPSKWESQKYVILGHLASSPICTAIIYKELQKPSLAAEYMKSKPPNSESKILYLRAFKAYNMLRIS